MPQSAGFDAVADDLYGLPRTQFTASRDASAREARAAGDFDLATALRSLRKPTTAAWLANVLVRERAREVARLVELGAQLRSAQAAFDADALRRLSQRRHDLVGELSRDARRLAAERGETVRDAAVRELEGTLEAAAFDPDAADQVRIGRLTGALAYSGIGFSALAAGAREPRAPAERSQVSSRRRPGETRGGWQDQTAVSAASLQARREAWRGVARTTAVLETAERAVQRKRAALEAAEEELARRREALRAAERDAKRARGERVAAERDARRAEQGLSVMRAHLRDDTS